MAPVLAIDLGGTKLAAALVDGGVVQARREVPTDRAGGPVAWIEAIVRLAREWTGFATVGVAVTGLVRHGLWRAVNPATLDVPGDVPLTARLEQRLGVPVVARNDAQAAAWGEFRYGAGQGCDMVFVTVSTGVGGGVVLDGRLVEGHAGLAGHLGITPVQTPEGLRPLEDVASGSALARLAGNGIDARAVTTAAAAGEAWAAGLLDRVQAPLGSALRCLHLILDPERIVVGGGLGLAPGYLDRLERHLEPIAASLRPRLRAAALGADAGLIGVADLATTALEDGP